MIRFLRTQALMCVVFCLFSIIAVIAVAAKKSSPSPEQSGPVLTGQEAFTDAAHESPGIRRHLTVADLPAPAPDQSVDNGPSMVPRPANAWPIAPKGFKVELYATGLDNPRLIRFAPNGDLFLAESESGKIKVFRGVDADGKPKQTSVFATGLHQPFGIAFYPLGPNPQVGLHRRHRRHRALPLSTTATSRRAAPWSTSPICPAADACAAAATGPATSSSRRTAANSSPPSARTPTSTTPTRIPRNSTAPTCSSSRPTASSSKVYAWGIRNCVGEAINPITGELWCSTNERDALGNNLVPDYITHVQEGGFYGWPWYYMGGPTAAIRIRATRASTPSCKSQGHHARHSPQAALRLARDDLLRGLAVPRRISRATASPAEHGSWNRAQRSGYEVIRLPMHDGHATGEYEDFLTGFTVGDGDGDVWGRPVGVAVAPDGSLFVSDDGSRSIWHVIYTGK